MSTPNPLIPQGTFQAQAAKGASNVRLAVATIVAIHIVFFGGLLLQGCKRDPQVSTGANLETNTIVATNIGLAPLDSNALFYPSGAAPSESGTGMTAQPSLPPESPSYGGIVTTEPTNAETLWQSTNLGGVHETTLSTPSESGGPMTEYTIVRGDTLGAIAKRNQTTLSALRKANPGVDPLKIRPGQKLQIPAPDSSAKVGSDVQSSSDSSTGAGGKTYVVKSGDTLTRIARIHGITIAQLRAANNLTTSRVNVGQKLRIPASTNANGGAVPPAVHPVRGY
jgi:LysM repeat protein